MIGLSILMILCLVFKLTYISPFIKTQKENSAFIVLLCSVPSILHLQFCWCFWLLQYHSKMNEPSKKGRNADNIYGIAGRCLPMRTNTEYCQSMRIFNITFHKVIH